MTKEQTGEEGWVEEPVRANLATQGALVRPGRRCQR